MALAAAAAFVNTETEGGLDSVAELEDFVTTWGWSDIGRLTRSELAVVRELRPRLRRLWHNELDDVVELTNALLSEYEALPQLVKHDGWDYHLHAVPSAAPLSTRMALEAALALTDVIRAGELERLRVCAADDCDNVLVDLSKNRSRRFCEKGCGNRANVAAYRARKAAG